MRFLIVLIAVSIYLYACSSNGNQPLSGSEIYKTRCVLCHGNDGKMGMNGARDLTTSPLTVAERIEVINNGQSIMPSFKNIMSEAEIKAVAEYTMMLK